MPDQDDEWPKMEDGCDFDGRNLLALARDGRSPFRKRWHVMELVREIEESLKLRVVDIPFVSKGSNFYGIHMRLSNGTNIIARFSRSDVNTPEFDSFPFSKQVPEAKFEAAVYGLLRPEESIRSARLMYHRLPVQHEGPRLQQPKDIAGRRLFVFEKLDGEDNVWNDLDQIQKATLLIQAACIRSSLFNFRVPSDFSTVWLHERVFEHNPESLPVPVAPPRDFCLALFTSKINATIRNLGDMIGWESDNVTVGPVALKAKQSLLRLIPMMLPVDDEEGNLYRLVLEHGDFGIHNMSIAMDNNNQPSVTSVYDWETGCIAPAILSDPKMAVIVDLGADEKARASISRLYDGATPSDIENYMSWAKTYIEQLYHDAPTYQKAIKAGKDARHLWFALRDWRGQTPEKYFGDLGTWAEQRIEELGSQ